MTTETREDRYPIKHVGAIGQSLSDGTWSVRCWCRGERYRIDPTWVGQPRKGFYATPSGARRALMRHIGDDPIARITESEPKPENARIHVLDGLRI